MPNGTYNPCDPLTRITSGFDRPQDLHCIRVDGERVFVGYLDQCERNLVDFKGIDFKAIIEPLVQHDSQKHFGDDAFFDDEDREQDNECPECGGGNYSHYVLCTYNDSPYAHLVKNGYD